MGSHCAEPDVFDLQCPFCAARLVDDGLIDIEGDPGEQDLIFQSCCPPLSAAIEAYDAEGVFGLSWEAMASHILGGAVQRVDAGQLIERGREVEAGSGDGRITQPLAVRIVTGGSAQREVFALIDRHHRHHRAPAGWLFGAIASRGSVTVGVAIASRPVSRVLQARGFVEITRLATFGDSTLTRDAASALYAACVREVKRRKAIAVGSRLLRISAVITYTLKGVESGASCRAAGFVLDGDAGGGTWSRERRQRIDRHPLQAKQRWIYAFHGDQKPRESHSTSSPECPA